jgi:hypothetical protein
MAVQTTRTTSGKVYDPVFVFMLVAVFLAVASSFALRAVVSGVGPQAAHAASPADDNSRDGGDRNSPVEYAEQP